MNDSVRPDVGGFISGPMEDPPKYGEQRPIVAEAVAALHIFAGIVDRKTSRLLLKNWVRHSELTSRECVAVILTFLGDEANTRECNG
jgi:hypothetical protein